MSKSEKEKLIFDIKLKSFTLSMSYLDTLSISQLQEIKDRLYNKPKMKGG